MRESVKHVMADVFNVSPAVIDDGTSQETLPEWDSLGHLGLIAALEEKFKIRFTTDQIVDMRSFEQVCNALSKAASEP